MPETNAQEGPGVSATVEAQHGPGPEDLFEPRHALQVRQALKLAGGKAATLSLKGLEVAILPYQGTEMPIFTYIISEPGQNPDDPLDTRSLMPAFHSTGIIKDHRTGQEFSPADLALIKSCMYESASSLQRAAEERTPKRGWLKKAVGR